MWQKEYGVHVSKNSPGSSKIDTDRTRQVINKQRRAGRELGLVIDLTNITRYYSPSEWTKQDIKHVKIPCKGRDAVPDNESVNTFVYEVMQFLSCQKHSKKYTLVHYTHGHNRTGFMIIHFLMRSQLLHVSDPMHIFAQARSPGIYKQDYIESLYMFYHETSESLFCPPTPEWKRSSDLDLNGEAAQDDNEDGDTASLSQEHLDSKVITNDDLLGDAIPYDQQDSMHQICYRILDITPSPYHGSGVEDVSSLSGKIIEFSWYPDGGCWACMRIKADKATPNDISTYRKVMQRITDSITEEVLLDDIATAAASASILCCFSSLSAHQHHDIITGSLLPSSFPMASHVITRE